MIKFLSCVSLFVSSLSFGIGADKGQINLVGPIGVPIKAGWSNWVTKLEQSIQINPIQILFWNNGDKCRTIPLTNVSVKYTTDVYWYNANFKDGFYYVADKKIEGIKLDFYLEGEPESCVVSVSGFRDIAE